MSGEIATAEEQAFNSSDQTAENEGKVRAAAVELYTFLMSKGHSEEDAKDQAARFLRKRKITV